jgi:hypothetical protein
MNSIETLTTFFGWAAVINLGILALSTIFVVLLRDWTLRIHAGIFGLNEDDLLRSYFQYLAQYKLAIFVFNLAPYFALRIIA